MMRIFVILFFGLSASLADAQTTAEMGPGGVAAATESLPKTPIAQHIQLDSKYDITQFQQGSILASAGSWYTLATQANVDRVNCVFNSGPEVLELSKHGEIPQGIKMIPENFNESLITNNVAYVRYSGQNGPVKTGDYITVSSNPGVGMKSTEDGFTIGVALENSNQTEKEGLLKIRVMVRYEKF
jgi:hypothetical protein